MKQVERVHHFQKLFEEVKQDNAKLREFADLLSDLEKRQLELSEYYQGVWIDDYNDQSEDQNHFEILNQDSIYNALVDQHELLLKMNKLIANQLYRGE